MARLKEPMAASGQYRAVRVCFHRGHYYQINESYTPTKEEVEEDTIPRHFIKNITPEDVEAAAEEDKLKRKVTVKPQKAEDVQGSGGAPEGKKGAPLGGKK